MGPGGGGRDPAAGRAGEQALADEEGFGDLLHGLTLLPHRDGERGQSDRSARLLGVDADEDAVREIALRSRGTPRIANRLLRRVRDYADVKGTGHITLEIAHKALKMLDVDPQGFDVMAASRRRWRTPVSSCRR